MNKIKCNICKNIVDFEKKDIKKETEDYGREVHT